MTQPRRGTWPCEPLAWPVPRSSLLSCWARWNPRWQAWDFEENSRTDVSQEGSSSRKRAIDSVQQNSIIGLDVDIMVAAAPGDTNHSIPAIVDEAVQTYLTVSQLFILSFLQVECLGQIRGQWDHIGGPDECRACDQFHLQSPRPGHSFNFLAFLGITF